MHDQPRSQEGKFSSYYNEPRGQAIAIRLPKSLDNWLSEYCQEHDISKSEWLLSVAFNAISENLEAP